MFEVMMDADTPMTITCPVRDLKLKMHGETNVAYVDGERWEMTEAQYNKVIMGLKRKDLFVKGF